MEAIITDQGQQKALAQVSTITAKQKTEACFCNG
jgi:hypothetical protein